MPNDDEKCRAREQIELCKKEQESFVKSLDSKEITDTLQANIKKRQETDEGFQKEFDKRFRRDRLAEEIDGR